MDSLALVTLGSHKRSASGSITLALMTLGMRIRRSAVAEIIGSIIVRGLDWRRW